MITVDKDNKIISFSKRLGKGKTISLPLVSAHICPICNNITDAIFRTDVLLDTYPYEEVNILKLEGTEKEIGTVQEILPNDKHKRKTSCYNATFDAGLRFQRILLKNHIVKKKFGVNKKHDGSHIEESGPKPCTHTAIVSMNKELAVKDFLFFSGQDMNPLRGVKIPSLEFFAPIGKDNKVFITVPAIGEGQDAILVRRKTLIYGYNHTFDSQLNKYLKEVKANE